MKGPIRLTLLGDGSSDRCLLVILRHLVGTIANDVVIESHWADLRHVDPKPLGLAERIAAAVEHYPSDILFVHRDAEAQPWQDRASEILEAAATAGVARWVSVIPIRMTEAWLLLDESAIRRAADNPTGTGSVALPTAARAEKDSDPKATLHAALVAASEKSGRRLRRFRESISARVHRVAELIVDYGGLQSLPAYQRTRADTEVALKSLGYLD
jgi:hypothetical protein